MAGPDHRQSPDAAGRIPPDRGAPAEHLQTRQPWAFASWSFPTPLSLQHSSKSIIRRYSGFSPWAAAAVCLPGILLAFGAVFYLSLKLDRLLAQKGKAEIYRVIRRDGGFEVHFGLGTEHGVEPGLELRVYNLRGKSVGLARVEKAAPRDAIAVVTTDQEIRPGFMVCRETQ